MLKIMLKAETGNDITTPSTIANAVVDLIMNPNALDSVEDWEVRLEHLEEVAEHILLFTSHHKRICEIENRKREREMNAYNN